MSVLLTFAVGATIGVYGVHYYRNLRGNENGQAVNAVAAPTTQGPASSSSSTPEAKAKDAVATPKKAPAQKSAQPKGKIAKEDKLSNISGIGPTYAKRLRKAGIVTVSQLAETSAETLQSIVAPTPKTPRPNVEPWLKQAVELASK